MKTDKRYPYLAGTLISCCIAVLVIWGALPLPAQEPGQNRPVPTELEPEVEARQLGTEAFVYGYPLVIMTSVKEVMTNVSAPEGFHAPLGQFGHMRQFPDASVKGVAKPDVDTLYSFAWLDLSQEPYLLSLPEERGRYYSIEMLDAWTNVFAAPGKRTTGTRRQKFIITGPDWHTKLPRGIKEIKSPTNLVWLIGRTYCRGTPRDYQVVHALQDAYKLTPLSAFGRDYTPPRGTVDPNIDMKTPAWEKVGNMDAAAFFHSLAGALKITPPRAEDAEIVGKMAKIGIIPGQDFDMSRLNPAAARGLMGVPRSALAKIMDHAGNANVKEKDWSFTLETGAYGTDYLQRAYVAAADLGANRPQDMLSLTAAADATGTALDGRHQYILHFPRGRTPPVGGFWSLTMYNQDRYFVPNSLHRYRLNSFTRFRYNRDGSLDLYLQKDSPGQGREANWLPAPEGSFFVVLRMYWPREAALNDTWIPPAITLRNRP
jgi:hypothetical protein